MNKEEHIEENLRIAAEAYPGSLTPAELQLIARVEETYRRVMKVGCTGCRYCMPCPEGVDIPFCFQIFNDKHTFGDRRAGFTYITMLAGTLHGTGYASLCKDCGRCVKKCPQHLAIPELLRDVAAEFEGFTMKPTAWIMRRVVAFMAWRDKRRGRKAH